jgi:hypothetical protein
MSIPGITGFACIQLRFIPNTLMQFYLRLQSGAEYPRKHAGEKS